MSKNLSLSVFSSQNLKVFFLFAVIFFILSSSSFVVADKPHTIYTPLSALSLDVDGSGNIYVASNTGNNGVRITKFDFSLDKVWSFNNSKKTLYPVLTYSNDYVYVSQQFCNPGEDVNCGDDFSYPKDSTSLSYSSPSFTGGGNTYSFWLLQKINPSTGNVSLSYSSYDPTTCDEDNISLATNKDFSLLGSNYMRSIRSINKRFFIFAYNPTSYYSEGLSSPSSVIQVFDEKQQSSQLGIRTQESVSSRNYFQLVPDEFGCTGESSFLADIDDSSIECFNKNTSCHQRSESQDGVYDLSQFGGWSKVYIKNTLWIC